MPCYGGLTPCPRRMGGGKPRVETVLEGLNKARGDAYDTSWSSTVYVDNLALARAIALDGWGTNQRLANQRVPSKMTDMLPRWEKILSRIPDPSDSANARRGVVGEKFGAFGLVPERAMLVEKLSAKLGSVYVNLEYIPIAAAVVHVPDGSYPFGTVGDVPWSSTVARLLVRTQQPAGMSLGQFLTAVNAVYDVLEPHVPAWITFDWYLPGPVSVSIPGGPSAAGFYLDDPHNLDFEIFD